MSGHTLSAGDAARRSHSIVSAIRSAVTVWYALLGGIGAWTIHLLMLTSFVRFTCNADDYVWVLHLTTAVTLAMTVAAMALSQRLVRQSRGEGVEADRTRFIGQLGLVVGAVNLMLIALEGLYVFVLGSRRCG
jgi:hypothetical protein